MTAPAIVNIPVLPSRDELDATALELVTNTLERLYYAKKSLDKPLTPNRIHAIQQHLTVLEGNLRTVQRLLTPPLRPDDLEVTP